MTCTGRYSGKLVVSNTTTQHMACMLCSKSYHVLMTASVDTPQAEQKWTPDHGSFGARLAAIRHKMGWNVKEAAIACGVPPQNWRNWEAGDEPRRLVTICMAIASRTNVDLDWLVYGPSRAQLQEMADHSTRYGERNPPERSTVRVLERRTRLRPRRSVQVDRPLPTRAVAATRPTARATRPVTRIAVG